MSEIRSWDEIEGMEGEELTPEERRHCIFVTVRDLVPALLNDDRKDTAYYPYRDDIEAAIEAGEVSVEEMVAAFEVELREYLS